MLVVVGKFVYASLGSQERLFATNRTAPSPNRKFTPPVCLLLNASRCSLPVLYVVPGEGWGLSPRPMRPSKLADVLLWRIRELPAMFTTMSRSPTRIVLLEPSWIPWMVSAAGRLFVSGPSTHRFTT